MNKIPVIGLIEHGVICKTTGWADGDEEFLSTDGIASHLLFPGMMSVAIVLMLDGTAMGGDTVHTFKSILNAVWNLNLSGEVVEHFVTISAFALAYLLRLVLLPLARKMKVLVIDIAPWIQIFSPRFWYAGFCSWATDRFLSSYEHPPLFAERLFETAFYTMGILPLVILPFITGALVVVFIHEMAIFLMHII